ncbi:SDR family NAD(P)-dependent oxidoreductase [Streptomyces sp. NPDC048254]|uniref:SDR family NAD(P)-dependent oxidoreductase n=1 Tax=Streptomyces sp. NPDC048254 TaxID=3365525 RepID=UPI003710D498
MTGAVRIDFTGRVALVTGGGYGMGRASALRFAECGAAVVVADIDQSKAAETVELIREAGGKAESVHVDVGYAEGVREMVDFTVATFGGLDYAHNNAGIVETMDLVVDYSEDLWERVLRTNLTSVFLCLKYEIPRMLERGGGAIVNVASESTYKGNVADIGYTASKHGVVGLTASAGLAYAKHNIRVNAIAPGNVDTGIIERARQYLTPRQIRHLETVQPVGRLIRPEEIAELVVWLCSDAAALLNAAKIAADTGWHVA